MVETEYMDRLFDLSIGENNTLCNKDAQILVVVDLDKHVDVKGQFLVEHTAWRNVKVRFGPTDETVASVLTKKLKRVEFHNIV